MKSSSLAAIAVAFVCLAVVFKLSGALAGLSFQMIKLGLPLLAIIGVSMYMLRRK